MSSDPFWFVDWDLLKEFLRAEIAIAAKLLTDRPELPKLFDIPDATIPQRTLCFDLLAHRKLIEALDEGLVERHDPLGEVSDFEQRTLNQTFHLIPDDAPEWALEMDRVVEQIPQRIQQAMPAPLQMEGYFPDTEERHRTVRAAASELSTVEQVQMFVMGVFDEQLRRLAQRWSAASPVVIPSFPEQATQTQEVNRHPHRKRHLGKRDNQRKTRDKLIAEIADITNTPTEYVRLMDERKVAPLPTWTEWPGTWKGAYLIRGLRKLIHQDKSRACARARHGK